MLQEIIGINQDFINQIIPLKYLVHLRYKFALIVKVTVYLAHKTLLLILTYLNHHSETTTLDLSHHLDLNHHSETTTLDLTHHSDLNHHSETIPLDLNHYSQKATVKITHHLEDISDHHQQLLQHPFEQILKNFKNKKSYNIFKNYYIFYNMIIFIKINIL